MFTGYDDGKHVKDVDIFRYGKYIGSCDFDEDDDMYYGMVLRINDIVTYAATTREQLKTEFEKAVDTYIKVCEMRGREPEVSIS